MTDIITFPAPIVTDRPDRETVLWQGIPGVAQTGDGALWVTWYTGGPKEPSADNFAVLERSTDDGASWTRIAKIEGPGGVRVFDPTLWVDPSGRLWHFWNQTDESIAELFDGAGGVWARHASAGQVAGTDADLSWSEPRRLTNGVSMNKPIVLSSGAWLLPASVWGQGPLRELGEPRDPNVYASTDEGETWALRGSAQVPSAIRTFDEHMIVELRSGDLWMLIRTLDGLAESFSPDGGAHWTIARPSGFNPHTSSRVFFRRLQDGRLMLVRNAHDSERTGLCALTSSDDGLTWSERTLLDDREVVTYPDATQLSSGELAVVYDRERAAAGEILLRRLHFGAAGAITVGTASVVSAR
ncbi:putative neuraminidase [Kribbella aluminosa]|uniref:Neuraminidase n=1 Tax=Kribbella aluminosa TaxID=416017 RepID=A0ABS4UWD5_9ACTN|nr:sialidase family protein [Kribbella aluminosa]MBP2355935.1 putative neuraminidase [Kribbella aluminosa]